MPAYVALLRGIGPTNPNLRNENLCAAVKAAGGTEVKAVLGTGNIVFESTARSAVPLEAKIEAALKKKTGVAIETIVVSRNELDALIARDPFGGAEHGKEWYMIVTFRKDHAAPVCNKFSRGTLDGPAMMADLEKKHGRHITTRTWNTLLKIRAKMGTTAGK